ncbi:hypothetical protein KC328_g118 [Hortaea werneckii]|nr:hypothetical protein KC328_g118 [Hortaea werneckii]
MPLIHAFATFLNFLTRSSSLTLKHSILVMSSSSSSSSAGCSGPSPIAELLTAEAFRSKLEFVLLPKPLWLASLFSRPGPLKALEFGSKDRRWVVAYYQIQLHLEQLRLCASSSPSGRSIAEHLKSQEIAFVRLRNVSCHARRSLQIPFDDVLQAAPQDRTQISTRIVSDRLGTIREKEQLALSSSLASPKYETGSDCWEEERLVYCSFCPARPYMHAVVPVKGPGICRSYWEAAMATDISRRIKLDG